MASRKKRLSRKEFLAGMATVGGAAALEACQPAPTAAPTTAPAAGATSAPAATAVPAKTGPKPKIVIWCGTTYTVEADSLMDKQIVEWCVKNNVEVELNRMSGDERTPKWKTAYETKQFPDMGALEINDAPKFMTSKLLVETTAVIDKLNKVEGGYTTGAFTDSSTPDGKHWCVPSFSSTEVFYVRKDKLQAKGLAIPTTWAEVSTAAKAITEPGKFWGWGLQMGTPSWDSEVEMSATMWAYGAKTWDEAGKVAVDSAETRQVLDFFKDAWKSGCIPPDATTWDDSGNNKAYQTGIAGMIWNTPSVLAYMEKSDADLLSKTEITLLPSGPKGRFTSGYYYQWGAFNTTKYPDICLALMEYLFSPDQLRPVYDLSAGNMMPVFKNMINDAMWKKSPQRETVTKMVEFTVPQGYPGATKPWIQDAWMDHTMAKMLNRVLIDGWDNDKAIAEAKTALQKWYDDWQKKLGA